MALNDYSCINSSNTPVVNGFNPRSFGQSCNSKTNLLAQETDLYFIILFTIECVLKVVAMGFFIGK